MTMTEIRALLGLSLLLFASSAVCDVWSSLYREKLQEANSGSGEAQFDVGTMYQNGRGVKADRDKAIEWYGKAAEQGNTSAVSRLGLMEANQASFSSEMLQAEQGNAESQYNVGNMFAKGNGTNMDLGQAVGWYEKAASQGHTKAAYKLGLAYYEGSGVRTNARQARKWFSVAADENYAPAQYYLGKIYADGNGVRKSNSKALAWFTKAVDGGFDQARGEMIDITERMQMQTVSRKPAKPKVKKAKAAGVKIGFGTDLLGETHEHQSEEFIIRSRVLSPAEVIRSATLVNAEILTRAGELGEIAPGALADLLVVDGDPLQELSLLTGQGERLVAIVKDGEFVSNRLS